MPFKKGDRKPAGSGRQPGGTKAELNLKAAILGALEAVDGQAYLERVARKDMKTFCTLLARVLPMTVVGDKDNPIHHLYEVHLGFGQRTETHQGEHGVQDGVSGPAADIKALVHMRSA